MLSKSLFKDAMQMLTSPKAFFAGVNKEGSFGGAFGKAVAYSAIAGILFFVNELVHPQYLNWTESLTSFVTAVIFGIIGLFLGAFVLWIIAEILGAKSTYLNCINIAAALFPFMVIFTFMNQVISYSGALSWILLITVWIYALYVLFCALAYGARADEKGSKTMVGVLVLVIIFSATIPLLGSFLVREYQMLRMQVNQKMQQAYPGMARRGMMPYGRNQAMRYPAPMQQPGQNMAMPANPNQMPGNMAPQNPAPAANAPFTMTPQNYEMIKRMINSNTKMTPAQKQAALQRLEAAQKNQNKQK